MTFDFTGLYEFHGHKCPMSTMGARLGLAAMEALGVGKPDQFSIEGRFFAKNCALDGIQYVTGCTLGNGNLSFEDSGRAVFVLGMKGGGSEVTVAISDEALVRFAAHKSNKAGLLEEREISGLPRAMEIDGLISRDFEVLIEWVQTAPSEALVVVTGN